MTTVTIKNGKNISRTHFENEEELLAYFMDKVGFGTLIPLDKDDLTAKRIERNKKALNTPKSKMLNI
jgi:hypothetical protein